MVSLPQWYSVRFADGWVKVGSSISSPPSRTRARFGEMRSNSVLTLRRAAATGTPWTMQRRGSRTRTVSTRWPMQFSVMVLVALDSVVPFTVAEHSRTLAMA